MVAAGVKQAAGQNSRAPAQPAPPLHRLRGKPFLDGFE
jgi:hypothetical protein